MKRVPTGLEMLRARQEGAFTRRNKAHDPSPWRDPVYLANRKILLADKPTCALCHKYRATTADHVVPVRLWPKGKPGLHSLENLRPLCRGCNAVLGARLGAQIRNAQAKAVRQRKEQS